MIIMTSLISKIYDFSFLWKLFVKDCQRIFFLRDLNNKSKLKPTFICFCKFCGAREKQEWETHVLHKDRKNKQINVDFNTTFSLTKGKNHVSDQL